ncbi:uncharacterized protein [Arachis hypogaea]|uniref:uncharacterized protein n=1 Tax=Arachis hypogaea TaxID=3818 RepID=UPI003B20D9F2
MRGYQDEKPQYQVCNKIGHTARTCWYKYNEDFYEGDHKNENGGYGGYSKASNQPYGNKGYSSGNNQVPQQNLLEKEEYCGDEQVIVDNGIGLPIFFVGNLCYIKTKDTQEIVLQGIVHKGLYKFTTGQSKPKAYTSALGNKGDVLIWHARLGHPNHSIVSQAKGVVCRFSCPHVHQQNGTAKRKHRHVVEMGLTLLAGASIPTRFWGEAFTTAAKLINMLPTPVLEEDSEPVYAAVNSHSMITRSKAEIFKAEVFSASVESRTMKQAQNSPEWRASMDLEYDALIRNNTWELVSLPPNREAIGSRWVFRLKYNADGSLQKYKARLVAQGYALKHGSDFTETYSLVTPNYVLLYVDDIILIGEFSALVTDVIAKLNKKFALKDIRDLHYFLGIQITRTCDGGLASKKQSIVARLSTETEYRSMVDAVVELICIKTMMSELLYPSPEVPMLYCDNLSVVLLAANPILHSKSKHFEIDLHFVRDHVNNKEIRSRMKFAGDDDKCIAVNKTEQRQVEMMMDVMMRECQLRQIRSETFYRCMCYREVIVMQSCEDADDLELSDVLFY